MIKLSLITSNNKTSIVHVNPAHIVYFEKTEGYDRTMLVLSTGVALIVSETPAEILKRL